jgi:hypothetical protein
LRPSRNFFASFAVQDLVASVKTPYFVIPRASLIGEESAAASRETADSSRDTAALRNDNPMGIFPTAPLFKIVPAHPADHPEWAPALMQASFRIRV